VLRVIGPDLAVLDLLRLSLSRRFEATKGTRGGEDGDAVGNGNRDDAASSLRVSNRYFDASIGLHDLWEPLQDPGTHREDGVLLVVAAPRHGGESQQVEGSASPPSGLDALAALHGTAEAQGKAGDLLRLCVVVTRTAREHQEARTIDEDEYSRRILWCLDRGYEYVEVDLSEDGVARGHDERDKEGFARVVEAIQTTVWSSAVMRPRRVQELADSYEQAKQEVADEQAPRRASEEAAAPLPSSAPPPPPHEDPEPATVVAPAPTVAPESDAEREERARQALLLQAAEEGQGTDGGGEPDGDDPQRPFEAALGGSAAEQQQQQHQQDRYFDQLEGALREAARIREMSRSGALSDEDRKKRAGDAAVLLMDLMGRLGGGLEDSEGEGEGGSDSESEPGEPAYDPATEAVGAHPE
jgi:hypothetical protein